MGGIDKLFEIGKNFRNEGLSRRHNPEFTMLEAYCAFGDYESMMETVQSLICHVAQQVLGTLVIAHERREEFGAGLHRMLNKMDELYALLQKLGFKKDVLNEPVALFDLRKKFLEIEERARKEPVANVAADAAVVLQHFHQEALGWGTVLLGSGNEGRENLPLFQKEAHNFEAAAKAATAPFLNAKTIDLTPNWRRARYKDLVREKAGADWFDITPAERRQRAHDLHAEIGKDYADFEVTGAVFEKLIEPTLIQPTFVTHLPKELVPLAKLSPDDPTTVEVFECCINGQEIAPGYTEQNDPIQQRQTLEHQAGGEQQKLDEDFLIALEHGMPPAGGIGIGIDRLCMMLLGQESIRDVILFPQLKPK